MAARPKRVDEVLRDERAVEILYHDRHVGDGQRERPAQEQHEDDGQHQGQREGQPVAEELNQLFAGLGQYTRHRPASLIRGHLAFLPRALDDADEDVL